MEPRVKRARSVSSKGAFSEPFATWGIDLENVSNQGFILTEDEASRLRIPHYGLRLEGGDAIERRQIRRSKFRGWQLKLSSLAVFGTDFHEGVKCARCNVKAEPLLEEMRDLPISSSRPAQFADQFAVGFEF